MAFTLSRGFGDSSCVRVECVLDSGCDRSGGWAECKCEIRAFAIMHEKWGCLLGTFSSSLFFFRPQRRCRCYGVIRTRLGVSRNVDKQDNDPAPQNQRNSENVRWCCSTEQSIITRAFVAENYSFRPLLGYVKFDPKLEPMALRH